MLKMISGAALLVVFSAAVQPALADEKRPPAEAKAAEKTRDEEAAREKRRIAEERAQEKRRDQAGRDEELGRMKKELTALREKAQHPETPDEARAAIKREIQQLEMRLKEASGDRPQVKKGEPGPTKKPELPPELREQAERLEIAARRIKHLRVAAENLMAAEMPDMAHELMKRAEGMEQDIAAGKEALMRRMHGEQTRPHKGQPEESEALRNENRQLQNELRELRGIVEKLKAEGTPKP